jgi:signal transduction histidine kinase
VVETDEGVGWSDCLPGLRGVVAADPALDLVGESDELTGRFAALIADGRPAILRAFARRLKEKYDFIPEGSPFREQAMATAADVVGDVADSVLAGVVRINGSHRVNALAIARSGRNECLSPADGLGIGALLLNTVLAALTDYVAADRELLPCFTVAVAALNESIGRRLQAVAAASAATILDRVHRAQAEERRRVARDLHDRVGEALAVGLRRLDLQEIHGSAGLPGEPDVPRETLVEAMRRLRVVTCDLREPPVTSLGKALLRHLDSVQGDTGVRLHISGDEAWAPPSVLDEVFLILREALRNALTHAAPQLVLIGVEVSAQELSAWVIDDGRGFSVPPVAQWAASGSGLASMRERAALVGGHAVVSSTPGHGTRVELHVPLPGNHGTEEEPDAG